MKNKIIWSSAAVILTLFAGSFTAGSRIKAVAEEKQIKPSPVFAYAEDGCFVYDKCGGKSVDFLTESTRVEIIKDIGTQWYYIRYGNSLGWVHGYNINIPTDEPVNKSLLDADTIEYYANRHFNCLGENYVWVDIDRQQVYILAGEGGKWKLLKSITCSTGKNESPTIRGNFTIKDRGEWFYSERLGSGAMYWVRFSGSYLFHSVAMDSNRHISDGTLGKKSSNGCVRMSVEDAKWFYDNIKTGTSVWIN